MALVAVALAAVFTAPSAGIASQSLSIATVNPANGSTVSGAVAWGASVSGGKPSRVTFSVDGTLLWSDAAQPYGGTLDTTTLSNGSHTLLAAATSRNGGSTVTSAVTVNVSNVVQPPPVPPSATAPPVVSGQALMGQVLNASTGTWSGTTPLTYAYQWSRCDATGSGCSALSGATASSHTVQSGEVGATLRVTVQASNSVGSATATSAATGIVQSGSTSSPLDFSGDWHLASATGYLTRTAAADYTYLLEESPDRLQLVTSPRRRGNYAVKLTLQQGDYEHNGVSERCEFAANAKTYKPGDEFWVAMALYLDPTFPVPASGGWAVFHQFFGETGGQSTGSPPIALEVTPSGNFSLTVRGGTKASAGSSAPKQAGHVIAAVTRGEWHDFLLHVRLAKDSTGLVEVWHRVAGGVFPTTPNAVDPGVNVLTVAGVDQNVYPETGYYRSTDSRPAILYTNGMWVRASRSQAEAFFN